MNKKHRLKKTGSRKRRSARKTNVLKSITKQPPKKINRSSGPIPTTGIFWGWREMDDGYE